ncbi:MAG: hypothetical protein AB4080_05935 [Trichodesmium sp.]
MSSSSQKKLPNSRRYFFARFSHLTKPLVWGPIGVVSLVLLFAWELSVNPEWLTIEDDELEVSDRNSLTKNLTPEEISIVSDIDTSSVLIKDLESQKPPINSFAVYQQLDSLQTDKRETSDSQKNRKKAEEDVIKSLAKTNISNIYSQEQKNNLPPTQTLPNTNLSSSPLLRSLNLLDETNQAENTEKPVNALQNAMNQYQSSQNKSQSTSNYQSPINKINLQPMEIKPQDIRPSTIINRSPSNSYNNHQRSNYNSNQVLSPVNVTPPKPYYTDLSGGRNQINNTINLPRSNYLPQTQILNPNLPPLPIVNNGFANNQNRINGVNNFGVSNYYNNQGYAQNQQQQYNYGVNPNQVNQNRLQTPSNNPFSRRNNSFYNRGYSQRWNNPFN